MIYTRIRNRENIASTYENISRDNFIRILVNKCQLGDMPHKMYYFFSNSKSNLQRTQNVAKINILLVRIHV